MLALKKKVQRSCFTNQVSKRCCIEIDCWVLEKATVVLLDDRGSSMILRNQLAHYLPVQYHSFSDLFKIHFYCIQI